MKIINPNKIIDKIDESHIIEDIYKNQFFNWLNNNGFDKNLIKKFLENKKISSIEQIKFNNILRKAKDEIGIDIIDSIIYLEDLYIKMKKIITILDNNTIYLLKKELSCRYKIKMKKNELWKYLE